VSILVNADTKVIVQGITGGPGSLLRAAQPSVRDERGRGVSRRRPAPTSRAFRCTRRSPTPCVRRARRPRW